MRKLSIAVMCSLGLCAPAMADQGLEITVDRVRSGAAYTHVYARIFNPGSSKVETVTIVCDVRDAKGLAMGSSADTIRNIGPNTTVGGDILVGTPNDLKPSTAECREN